MSIATAFAFIRKYHASLAWLLLVIAVVALIAGFAAHERRIGALNAALGTTARAVAVWQGKADSTDRVLKVQTASADTLKVLYDSARAHVRTRTVVKRDTVTRHDSTFVTDTVFVHDSVFVARADAAVDSCTEVRQTCADDLHARDSVIAGLRKQIKILKHQQPSTFAQIAKAAGIAAASALAVGLAAKVVK